MPSETAKEYYKRVLTVPFLDHLCSQFNERFSTIQQRATQAVLLIPPVSPTLDETDLEFFQADIPSPASLEAEIDCWREKFRHHTEKTMSLQECIKSCDKSMYPNIHRILSITATFPVTSCECERSISVLGNVKTAARSTMDEDRLTSLCLMSVHRDIDINMTKLVQAFALKQPRRMRLPSVIFNSDSGETESDTE